ncbi:hypothetical protein EC151836_03992 [Escherichia coli O145:H28]|nr:hypothetical protein EC151836_03992 [Escherichia coli O145:H28]
MKNNAQLLMPREKMLKFGISALTDVELLALFLRTGTRGKDVLTLAKEMLENFGSLYGLLTSEYEQFSGVHGIGVAKFAQLKGIAELARRYYNVRMREESPLLSPEMTREFLQSQLTGEEREIWHCCKVSDEAAFCLIQRPYISKTLLTRRISPRGSP